MATIVEPILASAIWHPKRPRPARKQRLSTSCKSIDSALQGGPDYGSITCMSAETNTGSRDVTQALLVSHLLSSGHVSATVIDTGQAVDVRRLFTALLARATTNDMAIARDEARSALERVRIMKTFDFEGLTESLGELRDALEDRLSSPVKPPRGTVPDSQDDDEMLDSPTSAVPQAVSTTDDGAKTNQSVGLLIIDDLTQLAAPLLKINHASGQALITSFMRSLAHLTRTHSLCTIIMNSTISTKGQSYKEESPSAFASCSARPALGKTWTHLLDLHLLLHQLPKTADDAKVMCGGQRDAGAGTMVSVLEVLQDRSDGRVGRWAAFDVDEGGSLEGVS